MYGTNSCIECNTAGAGFSSVPAMAVDLSLPGAIFHANGSITRQAIPETLLVAATPDSREGVACQNAIIDGELGLWARVFFPATIDDDREVRGKDDPPVVLYFHGGGFVLNAADTIESHGICEAISRKLGAFVVSVNYRLAPENRLPAAYDDGYAALRWLSRSWLYSRVDLSRIFVTGDSAGANIAHHVAMRAAASDLAIAGVVLIQPFFGGSARKPSEMDRANPSALSAASVILDHFWPMALPPQSSRDHPFSNVALLLKRDLAEISLPRTLVVTGGLDVLRDRGVEYCEILRECGNDVELQEFENADHAFYCDLESPDTHKLLDIISSFVKS